MQELLKMQELSIPLSQYLLLAKASGQSCPPPYPRRAGIVRHIDEPSLAFVAGAKVLSRRRCWQLIRYVIRYFNYELASEVAAGNGRSLSDNAGS
jgi:hypothetical protein